MTLGSTTLPLALHNYQPPKIESVLEVIRQTRELNIPIYIVKCSVVS